MLGNVKPSKWLNDGLADQVFWNIYIYIYDGFHIWCDARATFSYHIMQPLKIQLYASSQFKSYAMVVGFIGRREEDSRRNGEYF